jgi:hypothetical protein
MVKFKIFDKILKPSGSSSSSSSSSSKLNKSSSQSSKLSLLPKNNSTDEPNPTTTGDKEENENNLNSRNDLNLVKILNDEFSCSCCLELLKRPVTLACGHSFCQICLANWFLAASNTTCPSCRHEWKTMPKVNFKLKSSIEKLVKYELTHSYNSLSLTSQTLMNDYLEQSNKLTRDEKKILKKFEEKYKSKTMPASFVGGGGGGGFTNLFRNFNFNDLQDELNTQIDQQELFYNNNSNNNGLDDIIGSDAEDELIDGTEFYRSTNTNHNNNNTTQTFEYSLRNLFDYANRLYRDLNGYLTVILYGFSFGFLLILLLFAFLWILANTVSTKINFSHNIGQLRIKYTKSPDKWTIDETQEW